MVVHRFILKKIDLLADKTICPKDLIIRGTLNKWVSVDHLTDVTTYQMTIYPVWSVYQNLYDLIMLQIGYVVHSLVPPIIIHKFWKKCLG